MALLIHYQDVAQATPQISWLCFHGAKILDFALHSSLENIPKYQQPTYVLISGTQCTVQQIQVPIKKRQQLIQAIPYMLEEHTPQDIEEIHFAIGKPKAQQVAVAIISHELMQTCLQHLNQYAIKPKLIITEILAVPYYSSDSWSIVYWQDKAIVRTAALSGFTIEIANLTLLLHTHSHLPNKIYAFDAEQANLTELYALGIEIITQNSNGNSLSWFAHALPANHELNLLQNTYKNTPTATWQKWRSSAILSLSLAMIFSLYLWLEVQQLQQQRQTINQQMVDLYRQAVPTANNVVNPLVQMQQRLAQIQTPTNTNLSFLKQLSAFSAELAKMPNFDLKRLDYRGGNFDLNLSVADLQSLENLRHNLIALNFHVEIGSVISQNNAVQAQLRILHREQP
jgi:general secretion pathway protein L